jgi:hypothetical protein
MIDVICGAITSTVVDPAADVQPLMSVTVTLYVPPAADVAFGIDGFWSVDVNPFGPVQLYVPPSTVLAVRFKVVPARIGPLFPAVGAAGKGLTVAVVDPAGEGQPLLLVTVTEYNPLAAVVAPEIDGFCCADTKPLGPVQLYVAPVTVGVVSVKVLPEQIGPLLSAVGVAGIALTVAVVDPGAEVQPLPSVIVTEYNPLAAVVAPGIDGVCCADTKPPGPVQPYVAPITIGVLRVRMLPAQIGPLLLAVGVAGALTVTIALPEDVPPEQPEASDTAVTVYVVVKLGLTVRVAGLAATPFCV